MSDDWFVPPQLVTADGVDGGITGYIEHLYQIFCEDFIQSPPMFRGERVAIGDQVEGDDRPHIFWHVITGKAEHLEEGAFDQDRAQYIRWPRPLIQAHGTAPNVLCWEEVRRGERRIHLVDDEWTYCVVLAERKAGYHVLKSAFDIRYRNWEQDARKKLAMNPCDDTKEDPIRKAQALLERLTGEKS